MIAFRKAVKGQGYARVALIGPAGSGKTYTALVLASRWAQRLGSRVAVIDTEHGTASKYADIFDFDHLELTSFDPDRYIEAITAAKEAGYQVLVIDSLSHAWAGKDGILEFVDRVAKRTQSGNTFSAWREASPKHNALVEAMLGAPLHLIVTLRSKMEYAMEQDPKTGRTMVRKVGLQPIQRDGLEYEFDVVADLTQDNDLLVGKTRCPTLKGQTYSPAGPALADTILDWLLEGAPPEKAPQEPQAPSADPEAARRHQEALQTLEALYRQAPKPVQKAIMDAVKQRGVQKAHSLSYEQILEVIREAGKAQAALAEAEQAHAQPQQAALV